MKKIHQTLNHTNESKGLTAGILKHKWCAGIVGFIIIIFLTIGGSIIVAHDPSPVGHFRSRQGERAYKQAYANAMKLLPAPSRTLDVRTDYGTVRVYEFANSRNQAGAPIILLPGRSSGVPMWASNLKDLAAERSVFALDALGDAGLSVQTRKLENSSDQAAWLDQVFRQVGLSQVHLVGHSFGGWLAANYAARYPERVVTLDLLEPVFVLQGLRWQIYLKSIPASIPFLPESFRKRMLGDIGGVAEIDLNDPIARMIADATKYYAAKLPAPDRISEEQLKGLSMPVYAALAANSSLHDPIAAVRVAKANIRTIQVRNWPGATHSLPMEFPRQVDRELLNFIAANETR